jgi:hypothetical protein
MYEMINSVKFLANVIRFVHCMVQTFHSSVQRGFVTQFEYFHGKEALRVLRPFHFTNLLFYAVVIICARLKSEVSSHT